MSKNRPIVLTIAGFDPSAGAGILSDIKTFEQHHVYGLAINTGNTIQTENHFYEMHWTDLDFVLRSIKMLFEKHDIKGVKIGIIPSLTYLKSIVQEIKTLSPKTIIIWDTILKSSTDFTFISIDNKSTFIEVIRNIDLITPNYIELSKLSQNGISATKTAQKLSKYCPVLLKGGHRSELKGIDELYLNGEVIKIIPKTSSIQEKHGSGCVLSAAILANIALKYDLTSACTNAKIYIEKFLNSNNTLLGYHYV